MHLTTTIAISFLYLLHVGLKILQQLLDLLHVTEHCDATLHTKIRILKGSTTEYFFVNSLVPHRQHSHLSFSAQDLNSLLMISVYCRDGAGMQHLHSAPATITISMFTIILSLCSIINKLRGLRRRS